MNIPAKCKLTKGQKGDLVCNINIVGGLGASPQNKIEYANDHCMTDHCMTDHCMTSKYRERNREQTALHAFKSLSRYFDIIQ